MRNLIAALLLLIAAPVRAQDTYSTLVTQMGSITDAIQYAVPIGGGTVICTPTTTALVLNNATLLATLTVTLPPNPIDGQRILISSGAGVTILTLNGGTIKGLITSLSINGYARFIYSSDAGAWFRTG
jgi:hypothetical protein